MNRKGFTFIELLGVVVILGLIMVIAIPSMGDVLKSSKLKSEEIFTKRLSQAIDSYVTLNSNEIAFSSDGEVKTKTVEKKKKVSGTVQKVTSSETVTVFKGTITFQNIINNNLLEEKDFKNSGNIEASCNKNAEIEIYRDSDYVYCHKVKKASLNCLTNDYIATITGDYVIDTCTWK